MLLAVTAHKRVRGVAPPGKVGTSDWREQRGSAENTRRVSPAFAVLELHVALSRHYRSDAHLVGYVISPELRRQPRLNKSSLPWLAGQGFHPTSSVLICDVDNPGHVPWTGELRARWGQQWARLPVLSTVGAYETAHGLRLLQPLPAPVPVLEVELRTATWLDELRTAGLDPDSSCRDWTRLYRLPHVLRDGVRYTSPWVELARLSPRDIPPARAAPQPRRKTKTRARACAEPAIATGPADSLLGRRFRAAGLLGAEIAADRIAVTCPWRHLHTTDSGPTESILFAPHYGSSVGWFHCSHAHCTGRGIAAVLAVLPPAPEEQTPQASPRPAPPTTTGTAPNIPVDSLSKRIADMIVEARGPTIISAPCGAGKTRAARLVAVARAQKNSRTGCRTAISVPSHALAIQICNDLQADGIGPLRLYSPASLKIDGEPVCLFAEAAKHLAAGHQSVRYEMCDGRGHHSARCPHRTGCLAADGCEGDHKSRIVVAPHQLIPALDTRAGSTGLLVVDEPPPPIREAIISAKHLRHALDQLGKLRFSVQYAEHLRPVLEALASLLEDPSLQCASSELEGLLDELSPAGSSLADLLRTALLDGQLCPPIERAVQYRSAPAAMEAIGTASATMHELYQASICGGRATVFLPHGSDRSILSITMPDPLVARAIRRAGQCVLLGADALVARSGYEQILGAAMATHELTAADGGIVRRLHMRCSHASRQRWVHESRPPTGMLTTALRTAQDELAALGVPPRHRLVLVTFKPLLPWLREQARARSIPGLLELTVAHYGGLRGLDCWAQADGLISLGDPIPNIDSVGRVHGSATIAPELAAAELDQAHGRLRLIHRTTPAVCVHVGRIAPAGWTSKAGARAGRPAAPMPPDLRARVARDGLRATARSLGVGVAAIHRAVASVENSRVQ